MTAGLILSSVTPQISYAKTVKPAKTENISEDNKSDLAGIKQQTAGDKRAAERNLAAELALSLAGKVKYKTGGMHGVSFTTKRKDIKDVSDLKDADSSGFISYILYKCGAEEFKGRRAMTAYEMSTLGVKVTSKTAKPGDIIIKTKRNGNSLVTHVVMYLGKTSKGNFTIADCCTLNKKSGPQIIGYKDFKDFKSKRGREYRYFRNPYVSFGKLSVSEARVGEKALIAKITFKEGSYAATGSAITYTLKEMRKDGTTRPVKTMKPVKGTPKIYRVTIKMRKSIKSPARKYYVTDGHGNRSRFIPIK